MPTLSLPEAVRYFFAPFVIYFYFWICNPVQAEGWLKDLSALGQVSGLVSGCVIYFLYRHYIYDNFILWLYDISQEQNYRIYFQKNYCIPKKKILPNVDYMELHEDISPTRRTET